MTKPIPEWARKKARELLGLLRNDEFLRLLPGAEIRWAEIIARHAPQPLTQDLKHGSYTCPLCRQSTVKPVQPSASIRERAEEAADELRHLRLDEIDHSPAKVIASYFVTLPDPEAVRELVNKAQKALVFVRGMQEDAKAEHFFKLAEAAGAAAADLKAAIKRVKEE